MCMFVQAPLCPTTCCINIPQKGILTHDSDAKSIRIQQLRETMISISAEKAALSDAVDACHLRIAQMECVRANDLQGPCQVHFSQRPMHPYATLPSDCILAGRQSVIPVLGNAFRFEHKAVSIGQLSDWPMHGLRIAAITSQSRNHASLLFNEVSCM